MQDRLTISKIIILTGYGIILDKSELTLFLESYTIGAKQST